MSDTRTRFTLFSAFYPLFRVLPSFPFPLFRFHHSGSAGPFRFRVLPLPDPNASPEENAGLKFLTDQIYQTELLKEVNDRWESRGYMEYKSNLESILPQELHYQSPAYLRDVPVSDVDRKDEGLRYRVSRSKSDKKKIEHFALMDSV